MYVFANEVLTYEDETYEVESTPDRRKRFVTVSRGTMSKNSAAWEIGRGRDRDGLQHTRCRMYVCGYSYVYVTHYQLTTYSRLLTTTHYQLTTNSLPIHYISLPIHYHAINNYLPFTTTNILLCHLHNEIPSVNPAVELYRQKISDIFSHVWHAHNSM